MAQQQSKDKLACLLGVLVCILGQVCIVTGQCAGQTVAVTIGLLGEPSHNGGVASDYTALFLDSKDKHSWNQDIRLYAWDDTIHTFIVTWTESPAEYNIHIYNASHQQPVLRLTSASLPFHSVDTPCPSMGHAFSCTISVLCADATFVIPATPDHCEQDVAGATNFYHTSLTQKDLDTGLLIIVLGMGSVFGAILFAILRYCIKRRQYMYT
jgi:hypothetical protein